MKLGITGSRHWVNIFKLYQELDKINKITPITCIIHGDAKGADSIAGNWAFSNRIMRVIVYPRDVRIKEAYLERSKVIVDLSDKIVAFRSEGKSNGTDYTVGYAATFNKLLMPPIKER